jgi:DNA polymerase III delta subunit
MELKYKLIEEIMSELNMRNSENVLKCFERLLEEMSPNKLKGILEDLQEENRQMKNEEKKDEKESKYDFYT